MALEKESASHFETASITKSEGRNFGGEASLPPPPQLTEEEEKKLWRKVDARLMPILALLYLLSFMDRGGLYPDLVPSLLKFLNVI